MSHDLNWLYVLGEGGTSASNSVNDILLLKISGEGALSYLKSFGGSNKDNANKLIQHPSKDQYYILGDSNSIEVSTAFMMGILFKIDKDSNISWGIYFGKEKTENHSLDLTINSSATTLYATGYDLDPVNIEAK
jgi:hypothetical protein